MIAEPGSVLERPSPPRARDRIRPIPDPPPRQAADTSPGWGWRILLLGIGSILMVLGWSLVMTVLLAFIGLPVFIFGLALMQAQES